MMKMSRNNKGAVLILSVISTVILFVVISQYSYTTTIEYRLAENSRDNMEVYYIARAVKEVASALLLEDYNMLIDSETDLWGRKYKHRSTMMQYTRNIVGSSDSSPSIDFTIEDTARFINLAGIWSQNENIRKDTKNLLHNFFRVIRADHECGINDMEKRIAGYMGLDNESLYSHPDNINRKLLTQDELLDMPDIELENLYKLFFGYEVTRASFGGRYEESERYRGMKECTTIWGDNTVHPVRININTAPLEVLQAVILMNNSDISVEMAKDEANRIISHRDMTEEDDDGESVKKYFTSITRIRDHLIEIECDYAANSHRWFTVMGGAIGRPQFFRVTVNAGRENFKKEIRIILERRMGAGGRPEVVMHMWREVPVHVPITREEFR